MTCAHTPGPWVAADILGTTDKGHTYISGGNDRLIACVFHACLSRPAEYIQTNMIIEARANASLIAAAPDLLSIAQKWVALDGEALHLARRVARVELLAETLAVIAKVQQP